MGAGPPPRAALIPSGEEILSATLAPRCIVERYLFADVATLIAPGGTGKTTLLLYESVRIALGRTLHGLQVLSPGWTLIVTAEDARPRLLARLAEIVRALDLDESSAALVFESVIVWDVAGRDLRLARMRDGNVVLTALADDIAARYREDPPAVIVFDPLASFGASEQAVNDNEQALITASRRLVGALDCCVRLIHHTGKANARQATPDQYAGRGGSALADGSRMTTVLQAYDPETSEREPPPGCVVDHRASITILHRLKLSYAPPHLPRLWVRREGFAFESFVEPPPLSKEQVADAQAEQIERFLISQFDQGRYWTMKQLEVEDLGMSRRALRAAITRLEVAGRLVHARLPRALRHGQRRTFLCPSQRAAELGAIAAEDGEEEGLEDDQRADS